MKSLVNLEAERALLGCLILENKLIQETSLKVKEDDFYNEEYQKLYKEILCKYLKHEKVDITNLSTLNINELVFVLESVVTTSNINMYANVVVELAVKRNFIRNFDAIKTEIIKDETLDIFHIQSKALEIINNMKMLENNDCENFSEILCATLDNLEQQFRKGNKIYKSWGYKWLDEKTGGIKPAFTILAARPSVGKSALSLQLALNAAKQGLKVAFFSLEMPNEQNMHRILASSLPLSKDYFDKPWTLTDEAWKLIAKNIGIISNYQIKIYDKSFSADEIIFKCIQQKANEGLDFVVIDYLQLVESPKNFKSTNDKISYISRNFKKFQQQNGIHLLALSQLNRETEKQDMPGLYNLRDSGSLEQDADNVWLLHPVKKEDEKTLSESVELYLILAKQRGAERNIMKKFKFYGNTQRFYEN